MSDFWDAREELRHVHDFARNGSESPSFLRTWGR
jgi:hypothetical protein